MMSKAQLLLLILAFGLSTLTSCDGNDPQTDFAGIIEGTYTGTVTTGTGTVAGITTITKKSETRVDMAITAISHSLTIPGIKVSSADNNVYTLSFVIADKSLTGEVEGNTLTYTLASGVLTGTFTGTR